MIASLATAIHPMFEPTLLIVDCAVSPASGAVFPDAIARLSPPRLTSRFVRVANAPAESIARIGAGPVPEALLITGSEAGVGDRLDWVSCLSRTLRPLLEAGVPTLGICFGHQFIADAFGGRVETPAPGVKTRGVRRVRVQPQGAAALGRSGPIDVLVSHRDHVVEPPPGWSCIATSNYCAIQALMAPDLPITTVQWHPEANRAFIEDNPEPDSEHPWNQLDDPLLLGLPGADVLKRFLRRQSGFARS